MPQAETDPLAAPPAMACDCTAQAGEIDSRALRDTLGRFATGIAVVTAIDGVPLLDSHSVVEHVSPREPGSLVQLEVVRNGMVLLVPSVIEQRPETARQRRWTGRDRDVRRPNWLALTPGRGGLEFRLEQVHGAGHKRLVVLERGARRCLGVRGAREQVVQPRQDPVAHLACAVARILLQLVRYRVDLAVFQ